jgi:hypothetical protein
MDFGEGEPTNSRPKIDDRPTACLGSRWWWVKRARGCPAVAGLLASTESGTGDLAGVSSADTRHWDNKLRPGEAECVL